MVLNYSWVMQMKNNTYNGILYACSKGKQKEWAREHLIIDLLYNTDEETMRYLKFNDICKLDKCDEETEDFYIYKFGYHYQIPRTEIDLYVSKKNHKLFIKKIGIGYAYENVEKVIYNFIKEQIKNKNLYIRTNINGEEFLIK